MAKQQVVVQTPTTKWRTVTFALLLLTLLAFTIKDPSGAADLAHGIGNVVSGALDGVTTFFGAVN